MRNWWLIISGSLLCILGAFTWIGGRMLTDWEQTPARGRGLMLAVEIPEGASMQSVAESLQEAGVIEQARVFYHWARWVKNAGKEIKWGQLAFKDNMNPLQVLRMLRLGTPVIHRIEIPPGLDLEQVAALIRNSDLAVRGDILATARDESFTKSLRIRASNLEGYLAPGSYGLARHMSAETILKLMVSRRYTNWGKKERQRARAMRTNLHKVLTIASIIEAETSEDSEMQDIASVLYNRVINDWKLCSDSTVAYAEKITKGQFDDKVDMDDRMQDSPYNTWTRRGLPPGPICSPSEASIHAALWPKRTPFMYFTSLPAPEKGHRFCPDLLCALGRRHKKRSEVKEADAWIR